tara:strand:+ start:7968 stop:9875 length:1908 start_codon:yes stop_codon:yes gene_type:complete
LSPVITAEKLDYRKEMMFVLKNNFPNAVTFDSAILNEDEPVKVISQKRVLLNMKSTFPIRQGKNKLEIKAVLADGTMISQYFEFKTKKLKKKRLVKKNNELKLINNFYKTNKTEFTQNEYEMIYSVRQDIETNALFFETYGLYDDRGSKYTQPYSRLRLNIMDKKFRWKVKGGDIQENFSPLTVNGRRVRGLYADLDLLKFFKKKSSMSVRYIMGQSNKAIEISSGNVTMPTYAQDVKGYQLKLSGMKFKSSLQYFRVYDDTGSLSSESKEVTNPVENHIVGTFFQLRPTPLSFIEYEFVGSAYYADSEASAIDISELDYSDFVKNLINKYLPIKSSLLGGYSHRFTTQLPILSRYNIVKVGYDRVHPNYYNELNTFFEADKEAWSVSLTQKLFNRTLIMNTFFENEKDNILGTSSDTSNSNAYRFNTMYRTKNIGSINATGMLTRKTEVVTTSNEDLDNQLNYIMIGISGIPFKANIGKVRANISYSISDYFDYIESDNNSKSNTISINLNSSYNDYKASLGLSQSKTSSDLSGISRYLTVFSRVSKILSEQLKFSTKLKFSIGKNDSDSNKINSRKISNNWTVTYTRKTLKYFKKSDIRLGVEFIYMKDDANPDEQTSNFIEGYTTFSMTNRF